MTLGIDFDGTIVHGDTPITGAKEALQRLHDEGHYILIHSCNNWEWIHRVLNNNDLYYDSIWIDKGKPVCDYYIDDRAIRFKNDWADMLEEILAE